MIKKLLIANRGEIAVRIQKACRNLDIPFVQVFSEADKDAPYVKTAEQSVCIGPPAANQSYLDMSAIIYAALTYDADAIHPGYGFLSENEVFARQVEVSDLIFIGPSSNAIHKMGDKVRARQAMIQAGVPCLPGSPDILRDDIATNRKIAREIGYPVIIKAAGGGGGRGMRVVYDEDILESAIQLTKEEARSSFANADVYMERFLQTPRHIEIQVLADKFNNAIWLGERDCSLQRRHQKMIEEAPAKNIDRVLLAKIGQRCVEACRQIGYSGAGTFEFLYENNAFYFIEMNTRIQVEHPITEFITGLDLVEQQILIAAGQKLTVTQSQVNLRGHALECRINAEDSRTFQPSPGQVTNWLAPVGEGIRVDTYIEKGSWIAPYYDSLIAKIIVHADDRAAAVKKMQDALSATRIAGLRTNIPLHKKLLQDDNFVRGVYDIHYLENNLSHLQEDMV